VNLFQLQELADSGKLTGNKVTQVELYKNNLISRISPYKILGEGELTTKLEVEANYFSKSAKEKIEAVGGTITQI